jgi:hypothetical protein
MIFLSFFLFSRILMTRGKLFVPRLCLASVTDLWGQRHVRCHMGTDWSTCWLGLTSLPVITGVDYWERFRRCGWFHANQETMGSLLVHAPSRKGHRSCPRRSSMRRCTTAVYGIGLRTNSECNTSTNRRRNSPWGWVAAWSCQLWSEAMVRSPIPADHCERESPNWLDR